MALLVYKTGAKSQVLHDNGIKFPKDVFPYCTPTWLLWNHVKTENTLPNEPLIPWMDYKRHLKQTDQPLLFSCLYVIYINHFVLNLYFRIVYMSFMNGRSLIQFLHLNNINLESIKLVNRLLIYWRNSEWVTQQKLKFSLINLRSLQH